MYFDTSNKYECSGCTACVMRCPRSAIRMEQDDEGFYYPVINSHQCINCNICRKVCSWENPGYDNSETPLTLALILKDKNERIKSTSGGAFYAVAKMVIDKGGVVYGAAFEKDLRLIHEKAENIEELQSLRGSKYIQSKLGDIFVEVKHQLDSGRLCYFTGTGCQVAGLKAFLNRDYSNLVTSDLVCHGTPSQKMFDNHIQFLEKKYKSKVVSYRFRDYKLGEGCEICYFANRKHVIRPSYELSPYLYSFMHAYTYRYSCYNCKFAKMPRQGDITLADFWGVHFFFPELDRTSGTSLVFVNSPKGEEVWEQVKGDCEYFVSNVNDASKFNGNVIHPSNEPKIRSDIYKIIDEKGYEYVARTYFRSPNYHKLIINLSFGSYKQK